MGKSKKKGAAAVCLLPLTVSVYLSCNLLHFFQDIHVLEHDLSFQVTAVVPAKDAEDKATTKRAVEAGAGVPPLKKSKGQKKSVPPPKVVEKSSEEESEEEEVRSKRAAT